MALRIAEVQAKAGTRAAAGWWAYLSAGARHAARLCGERVAAHGCRLQHGEAMHRRGRRQHEEDSRHHEHEVDGLESWEGGVGCGGVLERMGLASSLFFTRARQWRLARARRSERGRKRAARPTWLDLSAR